MDLLHPEQEEHFRSQLLRLKESLENTGMNNAEKDDHSRADEFKALVSAVNDYLGKGKTTHQQATHLAIQEARWEWNPSENAITLTKGLIDLLGIETSSENSKLEDILDTVFSPDREMVERTLQNSYSTGKPFNLYYRITKSDNTMRFVHSRGKVITNENGAPERMVATVKDVTEQVIEENRYNMLMDTAPDAIVTTDRTGRIRAWNNKAAEYFGWNPGMKGQSLPLILLKGKHRQHFEESLKAYLNSIDSDFINRKSETIAARADGSLFPAEITISEIKLEHATQLVIFIRDISDQKNGESRLREKEELYRAVVESLFEGLIITDTSDRITFANSQIEKLTGYSRDELIGKIEYEVFQPEALHESIRSRTQKRLAGESETYELQFKKKDGTSFTGRVNAAPFRNAEGEIIGTVGAITDITSQKRKAELEELVIAATKSFNSVVITNKEGYIEWTNEGFTKLTGYTIDDVKGTRGEKLRQSEPFGIADHTHLLEQVLKRKEAVTFESKSFTKAGTEFWTITTLTPVLDENNEVNKIISIDTDITLRKKMEEQLKLANRIAENSLIKGNKALSELTLAKQNLEEAMRAKEQFLAHISHEIRTPMNGIIGLTDLLLKSELSAEQKEYLTAIKNSGDTLMVVINDILDLSKIEAGKMTFEEIPFNVTSILNTILELFTPKAREKRIQLVKTISDKIPNIVLGDPVRLNQILMNLVSNAIKFTEKGNVHVQVNRVKDSEEFVSLSFSVQDTGPGIPADKLHTLFVDFTQASTDITRKYGGTGLGLSIAKRLVELQGGTVTLNSKVGIGSEFTITLDFRKAVNELLIKDPCNTDDYEDLDQLRGMRILLVEDNPVNQLLAEKLLSDWGCIITNAENGLVAINKLTESDFDLVLMDIKMPEMDGYEATRYIRQKMEASKRRVPIIALTAHAAMWEAEKCTEAGMNGYISKPFNVKELYKMIAGNLNTGNEGKQGQPGGHHGKKYIDLTFLKSIAKGSSAFMVKLINTFIKQTSEEMKNLEMHLAKKDWTALHGSAHKMKPSFHFVGITELKEPILALEKNAKERINLETIPGLVRQVVDVCTVAIEELKEELKNFPDTKTND